LDAIGISLRPELNIMALIPALKKNPAVRTSIYTTLAFGDANTNDYWVSVVVTFLD